MEHKCPQCHSKNIDLFNHYYYSDTHHLKKHYKCLTCGNQWIIEDDPLDAAEHTISYEPDYSQKSANVKRQIKPNEKKTLRPKKTYDRQTAGQLSLSDLYGWNYGKK